MANQRYVSVGRETTYATAVAGTKSYEDTADDWELQTTPVIITDTTRAAQQAPLAHNYAQVVKGAQGSLITGLYDNGLGLLLANLLGTATAPTAVPSTSTGRFGRNYRTTSEGDDSSFTVRRGRIVRSTDWSTESVEEWAYAGCRPTNFQLEVSTDNPWMLTIGFDANTGVRGGAAVAQTYHSVSQEFFHWAHTKIQIAAYNASGVLQAYEDFDEFDGFTLTGNFNLKVDDHPLAGSANKVNPKRIGLPEYTGTLSGGKYTTDLQTAVVDRFRSGDVCALRAVAQKNSTTAADANIFQATLARVRFTGSDPQSPPGQVGSMLEAPFSVFWGGGANDYAIDLYLQNGDSTDS